MKVGIIGGTGYAGNQLITILKNHPKVKIEFISSKSFSNYEYSEIYHKLRHYIDKVLISPEEALEKLDDIDLIFLTLPHTVSMKYVKKITKLNSNLKIIDFSGDYRLKNVSDYEKYYEVAHIDIENIAEFVYGLPEINREKIKKSKYVSNPGCYPTSAILGLYPLIKNNLIDVSNIIVDSKSGISGAGRKKKENLLFTEIADNSYGYKVGKHRHQPEIIEKLNNRNINLLFSPHIIPSTRGILSTIYCKLNKEVNYEKIIEIYKTYYSDKPFTHYVNFVPKTKDVLRTNNCFIHAVYNKNTNNLIIYSVIDNLMKGASSQAVQNMNLMLGFDEKLGLDLNLFYL